MRGDRPGSRRRQRARREPLHVEPQRPLELVQAPQRLGVVAVRGDDQRAAVAVAGRQAGALLQLRGERRPALARGQVHAHQPLLAEVGLHHRSEHAGGHARGAVAGARGAIDDEHGQAALLGAPGAGEADQTGTDDNGVVACAPRQLNLLPFAGITRVRFDGRRRRSRPLSPVSPSSRWVRSIVSAIHSGPTAPQLSKRVLFRPGTGACSHPAAAPLLCAMKRLTITIAMLVAAAVAAPAASASSDQLLVMQDDGRVRSAPSETLTEFAALGADVVKVNLYWDEVEQTRSSFPQLGQLRHGGRRDRRSGDAAVPQHRRARAQVGHPRQGAPRNDAPEHEGVPGVRRRPRARTSRTSTSGRSGTSPTSTPGSAPSAATARRCRRRSTAASTWPATAA